MKRLLIVRGLLAVHIIGIILMAGTTLTDYLTFQTFWKLAEQQDTRSLGLIALMAKYGAFIRIGAVTLMLTGIALLIVQKAEGLHRFWFKVKLGLFFLLLLNGIITGNRLGHRFRKNATVQGFDFLQRNTRIRKDLNLFYTLQLTLFLLMISISMIQSAKMNRLLRSWSNRNDRRLHGGTLK